MGNLSSFASTSLTQSLGLSDILRQREREAAQIGELERMKGQVQAAQVKAKARKKRSAFQTVGTILGAQIGGGIGLLVGGPAGAAKGFAAGAKAGGAVGGGVSGVSSDVGGGGTARGIQTAASIGSQAFSAFKEGEEQKKLLSLKEAQAEADLQLTQAKTQQLLGGGKKKQLSAQRQNDVSVAINSFENANERVGKLLEEPEKLQLALAEKEAAGRFASENIKAIRNDIDNAIDIILRSRTGAVINPSERKEANRIFNLQTGDSANTIRTKMKRLETTLKLMGGQEISQQDAPLATQALQKVDAISGASEAVPVSRTPDGRVELSDGTFISREEAHSRFGGR
jgi:hypothetical protein